jgi:predicted metal-dependent peptidase
MTSFTPQEQLTRARVRIMRHPTFCAFTPLLVCGTTTLTKDIPTACTDGWNIKLNPVFMGSLTDEEYRFVLLHEAMHMAYQHLHTWRKLWDEDRKLANIAADAFVNLALHDADPEGKFIKCPSMGVQPDPKFRGWDVRRIYTHLKDNPPPQQPKPNGSDGQGDGDDGDGQGQGQGFDDHDWESAQSHATEDKAQAVQRAVRQGESMQRARAAQGAGNASGVFGDLLAPRADWKRILQQFVQDACAGRDDSTWRKPNRRYLSQGIYMPSMISEQMATLVVGFDTSGSCFGSSTMTRFVSELTDIITTVKPQRVIVLYADTQVAGVQVFENGEFSVDQVKPKGGGGTSMPCIFDWVEDNHVTPQACLIFTDGATPFSSPPGYPVLWAITDKNLTAEHGTTIHIEE